MSKIAIVGCDASGKTVLISSLSDYYKAGRREGQACIMVPADGTTRRYTDKLHRVMRINGEWPEATSDITGSISLKWKMMCNGREIADLELLDFGGENFRYAFRDEGPEKNPEVVAQLKAYIAGADFLVITVSMDKMLRNLTPALYRELENGDIEYDRDSEAQWVTDGLLRMVADRVASNPPGVVVALTQADKHRKELEEHGGAKALFAKCWPTIAAMYPELNVVPCASIDRMSADGLPADGYSTDGVLAVMKEYVRSAFGDCDSLGRRLDALQTMLSGLDEKAAAEAFKTAAADYRKALANLVNAAAIVGGFPADRLAEYEKFQTGLQSREETAAAESARAQAAARPAEGERAAASSRIGHPARIAGLLVILAAVLVIGVKMLSVPPSAPVRPAPDAAHEAALAREMAKLAEEKARAQEAERAREAAERERQRLEAERIKAAEAQAREEALRQAEARKAAEARARAQEAALAREKAEQERLRKENERIRAEQAKAREEALRQEEARKAREAAEAKAREEALRQEAARKAREAAEARAREEALRQAEARKVREAEEARKRAEEELAKARAKAQAAEQARAQLEEKSQADAKAADERQKISRDELLRLRAEERELKYQELRERRRLEREQLETTGLMTSLVDAVNRAHLERGRNLIADLSAGRKLSQGQTDTLRYARTFMDHLEKAQNGNAEEMIWIGNQYYTVKDSLGIVKNPREAFDWYQKAANTGSAQAYYFMSLMAEQGEGCRKDEALSGRYCLKAARLGNGEAMFWTGVYFTEGTHGFEKSPATAYKFLTMARNAGFDNGSLDRMIRRVRDESDEETIDGWFPEDPHLGPVKPEPTENKSWWKIGLFD